MVLFNTKRKRKLVQKVKLIKVEIIIDNKEVDHNYNYNETQKLILKNYYQLKTVINLKIKLIKSN